VRIGIFTKAKQHLIANKDFGNTCIAWRSLAFSTRSKKFENAATIKYRRLNLRAGPLESHFSTISSEKKVSKETQSSFGG